MTLACPSCGSTVTLRNPGVVTTACSHCGSTLYHAEGVLRAGERSIVSEPRSSLAVGRTGRVGKETLTIYGRLCCQHARGSWDEWYGETPDGRAWWLVEDERSYTLERALPMAPSWAGPDLPLGAVRGLGGRSHQVSERGEGVYAGVEGQLPRDVRVGSTYRYLDLDQVTGPGRITLEFHNSGVIEAFEGRDVPAASLQFGAPALGLQRPVVEAATLRCESCGAPVSPPRGGDPARTLSCASCGEVLLLSASEARAMGRNLFRPDFVLELGDKGKLKGKVWEVMGRMQHRYGDGSTSLEHLLWTEGGGYAWLEEEDGCWAIYTPTRVGPPLSDLAQGEPIRLYDRRFRKVEEGTSTLIYVDGALPWEARRNDSVRTIDYASDPHRYSVEISQGELERFHGQTLRVAEVQQAFGKAATAHRAWRPQVPVARVAFNAQLPATIVLGVAILNGALAWLTWGRGTPLTTFSFAVNASGPKEVNTPGGSATSEPFVIPEGTRLLAIASKATLDQSWIYLDLELNDEDLDGPVGQFGTEYEYYSGTKGGAWAEGSRSNTLYLRAPPAGTFTLDAEAISDKGAQATITVIANPVNGLYPLLASGVLFLVGLALSTLEVQSTVALAYEEETRRKIT